MSPSDAALAEVGYRPRHEVAEIFRDYGAEYRRTHRLPRHHQKAMRDLERCRTAALGGHVEACDHCGTVQIAYNSCRNRHCPKCQGSARARWVAKQEADLLPLPYFHLVFTLPDRLLPLLRFNPRLLLNLLFRAVSATLLAFGRRHLEGELGITAVLHTWGQTLCEHPHLHCLVTGGALAADGSRFVRCRPDYLFPVRALAQVFRGKYLDGLREAYRRGELVGPPDLDALHTPARFERYLQELRGTGWVVYAKAPFADPERVVRYLGRYTHRVALTNGRLLAVGDGEVRFTYKDYRDGERQKVLTLSAAEFIRRFLCHVLPPEFVRLRHYGLLANGRREAKLRRCRELLGVAGTPGTPAPIPEVADAGSERTRRRDWRERAQERNWSAEGRGARCAACGIGQMVRREEVPARERRKEGGEDETRSTQSRSNPHRAPPGAEVLPRRTAVGGDRGSVQHGVAADTPCGARPHGGRVLTDGYPPRYDGGQGARLN